MKRFNWWMLGAFIAIALLAFFAGNLFFGGYGAGRGWWPYHMGGWNMMGGYGFPWGGGFMGIGMLLVPLLVVGLIVAAVVALVRGPQTPLPPPPPAMPPPAARLCSNCSRPLQAEWAVCPYCGTPVSSA